ncbi:PAS domain-containing protein [Candidatus Saccharibacteria bacterium]|nr:PAS domain-containing protein [Candidatus Saccharibacteria bacterium]
MATKNKSRRIGWPLVIGLVVGSVIALVGWMAETALVLLLGAGLFLIFATSLATYWIMESKNEALSFRQSLPARPDTPSSGSQNARMRTLVNSLAEAIIAVDPRGLITMYNSAALELIDSHADILGESLQEVLPLSRDGSPVNIWPPVVSTSGIVVRDDLILQRKTGTINVYIAATPIIDQGQTTGAIVLARDVSQQKSLESQKDEFLSIVSHELRTPVATVEADVSTVLTPGFTKLPEAALKLLNDAHQNILYLSGLLQDISDLSHSQRLVLDTELRRINASSLVNRLVGDFTDRAKNKGLSLKTYFEDNLPEVTTSEQRLEEIMINFLTNAIKYSAPKGKEILITARKSKLLLGGLRLCVVDQGLGISDGDQRRLFKKFYRANTAEVQQISGTGMGLYIVARQAKQIGARLGFRSAVGKGSAFSIDLPPAVPPEKVMKAS